MAAAVSAHRVVIVGGGFGGLQAALGLRRAPVEITLVDRRNFHLFQPLSYQVATGALSAGEVAYPLRAIFKRNLVGFQNRMLVFIRWSFSFATRGRGARLISGPRSSGAQPD